ncbi:MAG: hypothetical protein Kow0010_02630 [Dehalococcoidia bacterium]
MSIDATARANRFLPGAIAEGVAWALLLTLAAMFVFVAASSRNANGGNAAPPVAGREEQVVIGSGSPAFRTIVLVDSAEQARAIADARAAGVPLDVGPVASVEIAVVYEQWAIIALLEALTIDAAVCPLERCIPTAIIDLRQTRGSEDAVNDARSGIRMP